MKRTISLFLAILLCLSVFSGCSSESQPARNVVELTKENFWKYIAVSYPTDFVEAQTDKSLECSVSGVLDYAFYENVVIVFDVDYYEPGAVGPDIKQIPVSITLNSAGDAEFEVIYPGVAITQNGKGYVNPTDPVVELYGYNRQITLKSVTGKVIYTV